MLKSYLIMAVRNLMRQRGYAAINISGLAIGVALALLALLYVHHEWSYDRFHANADRIHLVRYEYQWPGSDRDPMVCTPPVLAPTLRSEVPGVGQVVRVFWGGMNEGVPVAPESGEPLLARGVFVDSGFFEMFSFPTVAGEAVGALDEPEGMVLSREMAERCFGRDDPIGRVLTLTQYRRMVQEYVVRGVVEVPTNSSITFEFAISHRARGQVSERWGVCHVLTFAELPPGVSAAAGEERLRVISENLIPESVHRAFGGEEGIALRLLPLTDMHFTRGLRSIPDVLDPVYCWVVTGIALTVLAIACVNFVNLSLALMARRVREVGIRKTSGATRSQLVRQLLVESTLVALLSVAAGVALAEISLPVFGDLLGVELARSATPSLMGAGALALVVGLVTGGYPALMLSRFDPVEVLGGRMRFGGTGLLSRALVTLQFAGSILFAVVALAMARQVEFLRSQELGFDAEQVLVIDVGRGQSNREEDYTALLGVLRQAADEHPDILAVGAANNRFLAQELEGTSIEVGDEKHHMNVYYIEGGFLETLGISVVEGRGLDDAHGTDRDEAMLVNESLASLLGGSVVGRSENHPHESERQRTIVGVVADFQARPLRYEVEPAVFTFTENPRRYDHMFVRLAPGNLPSSVGKVEAIWSRIFPGCPFTFSFLDDDVANALKQDGRWIPVTQYAAGFAVFIASLGVFGLTALAVARRTKEIGIRKVVGAPVVRLVGMLSREFTMLVVAANVLAWPAAAYVVRSWTAGFAQRVELGLGPFLLAGALALAIAWATMGVQTARAARANPIEALRYE